MSNDTWIVNVLVVTVIITGPDFVREDVLGVFSSEELANTFISEEGSSDKKNKLDGISYKYFYSKEEMVFTGDWLVDLSNTISERPQWRGTNYDRSQ